MSTVSRSLAAIPLAALLVGACGPGVSADPLDPPPAAGACGLAHPAFCDTFEQPSPGGRGGDLDERFWGVARLSQLTNISQGANNPFPLAAAAACDGARPVAPDGSDYFFCARPGQSAALHQALNDGGGIILHAFHARRPFDFAGRVGTVTFSVDGWSTPGGWFEVWIADEAVPAVHTTLPGIDPLPRTGIGLAFQPCGSADTGLASVTFVQDHQVTRTIGRTEFDEGGCFSPVSDSLTGMEVLIGERAIEVRASTVGDPAGPRRVALISGLDLPLGRGYVHFETLAFNGAKNGGAADQTRVWDDIGFDGPFLPLAQAHDVPDHLEWWAGSAAPMTVRNTAYVLLPTNQQTFRLEGVELHDAAQAFIDLSAFGLAAGGSLRFRFNGGTWREVAYGQASADWLGLSIPVTVGDLIGGANVLELAAGGATTGAVLVANIDLTLMR